MKEDFEPEELGRFDPNGFEGICDIDTLVQDIADKRELTIDEYLASIYQEAFPNREVKRTKVGDLIMYEVTKKDPGRG